MGACQECRLSGPTPDMAASEEFIVLFFRVFVATQSLSSCVEWGFSLWWLLLLQRTGSRVCRLSSWSARA